MHRRYQDASVSRTCFYCGIPVLSKYFDLHVEQCPKGAQPTLAEVETRASQSPYRSASLKEDPPNLVGGVADVPWLLPMGYRTQIPIRSASSAGFGHKRIFAPKHVD